MTDPDDDHAAILAVVEAETDAYLRRDFEAWQACWHEGPEIRRIQTHVGTGVTVSRGPEIRAQMTRLMTEPHDWRKAAAVRRENLNIVVSSEMAWVSYDQTADVSAHPMELAGRYHELKILHKIDGSWKIACFVGTQLSSENVQTPLVEVDKDACVISVNETAKDVLKDHPLLGLSGRRLRAHVPDAQNGLMKALAFLHQIRDRHTPCVGENAVVRAIALGQDDSGVAQICWALLRDGKLLITFDDADLLDRQLASAAGVYGLSRMQERLARHLVEGCDLSAAAAALGVSTNTVKTHLQRIYDKTGVRAQPALIRVLLNANRNDV